MYAKRLIQLLIVPTLWVLYCLSKFIPRKSNLWVYGSPGNRFSDNAKYAFLSESLDVNGEREHWWVTGDRRLVMHIRANGGNAAYRWSIKGVWLCLRAKYYFFSSYINDVNFWTSGGAVTVNFWHGVPFKMIEFDIRSGPLSARYNPRNSWEKLQNLAYRVLSPASFFKPHYLYSPHPFFDRYFLSAFRVDRSALVNEPYPRVQYLKGRLSLKMPSSIEHDYDKALAEKENFSTVILYAPTFRDSNRKWVSENFLTHIKSIQDALEKINALLLIKAHPNELLSSCVLCTNIRVIDSQSDTYELMKDVDMLVTDYSSIAVDAAEVGLDVILLWIDFEEYKRSSRNLYFDLEEFYDGMYYKSVESFIEALQSGSVNDKNVSCHLLERCQVSE